jgi:hypothetical protein
MLREPTLEKLYDMKLNGMAQAFKEQIHHPAVNELSFDERFSLLVDQQWTWQEDRKMKHVHSLRSWQVRQQGFLGSQIDFEGCSTQIL